MQDTITTIYCVCADVLKVQGFEEDKQRRFTDAEVMTVPLVAALYHQGNHALTRRFLHQHGYTRNTLSASRFCRRLAGVAQSAWQMVFAVLSQVFKAHNKSGVYAVDSYPIAVCANCRIKRCALFEVQEHGALRGYQASKKQYFYGFKVHLLVTAQGQPIEFFLSEGSLHDLEGLKRLPLDLPPGSTLYGDKAYMDQHEEWLLQDAAGVRFLPLTRSNAKKPLPPCLVYLGLVYLAHIGRQQVETAFSLIDRKMPKHIHAVSPQGFLLKLQAAVIAFAFDRLIA
jgi:hypothetical protein